MRSLLFVSLFAATVLAMDLPSACQSPYTINGYTYDIPRLRRSPTNEYVSKPTPDDDGDQYVFELNICGAVNCRDHRTQAHDEDALPAACQSWLAGTDKHERMLGRFNHMVIREGEDPNRGFTVVYEQGDYCHHLDHNRSVLIDVECDLEIEFEDMEDEVHGKNKGTMPEEAYRLEYRGVTDECMYIFTLKTPLGCPLPVALPAVPDAHGGKSFGSILLILLIVGVSVYFVGGFVFLKFVQGKEGLDAIPNREFWTMVVTCGGRLGGGRGGSSLPGAGISAIGRSREGFNEYNDGI